VDKNQRKANLVISMETAFFIYYSLSILLLGFVAGLLAGAYWYLIKVIDKKNLNKEIESDE
jgi:hypothetical protein